MPRRKLDQPNYRLNPRRGRWFIDWTDPASGRTRSVSTGTPDRRAAEIWRDQWIAGLSQPAPPEQPLLSEILRAYQADRAGQIAVPRNIATALKPLIRHVGNLAPEMLGRRAYLEARKREGVSDGTLRREIGVLRAALTWAVREKWISMAPYVDSAPVPPPRERWLSEEEFDRLLNVEMAPHLRLFILIAYHTAARAGAILDLTWDRVNLDTRRIAYERPERRRSRKRRTTAPINAELLPALQEARHMALSGHVIEWHGKPVRSIEGGFRIVCDRAGIEECSPHVLRHTAATHLLMRGVSLSEVARFLGDTEAVVERIYAKHSPDYLRRAADSLVRGGFPKLLRPQQKKPSDS